MEIAESNTRNSDTTLSSKKLSKEFSSSIEIKDFDSFAKNNGTKSPLKKKSKLAAKESLENLKRKSCFVFFDSIRWKTLSKESLLG